MPMTEVQLQARRAMYERLGYYQAMAERSEDHATCVHWARRYYDLARAIDTMHLDLVIHQDES